MKLIKSKKILKILCVVLCSLFLFSIPTFAISDEGLIYYDGLFFETEAAIEEYKGLSDARKNILKNKNEIVVEIGEESPAFSGNETGNITPLSVMPESQISGQLSVTRNRDGTRYTFILYATWHQIYVNASGDKIAISWAGEGALISDSCTKLQGNGFYEDEEHLRRAEVENNKLVAYEIHTSAKEYCLQATVNKSLQPGLKNVSGGYAHKIYGVNSISVGVSETGISFSASYGVTFETMSPVYIAAYI